MQGKQVKCPDCDGKGEMFAIWHGEGGCGSGMSSCRRCAGAGTVSSEMFDWIRYGKTLRAARISRGESLREAAIKSGVSSSTLSAIENGHRTW